jgi:methanogenic corrinoid protein MtbC1
MTSTLDWAPVLDDYLGAIGRGDRTGALRLVRQLRAEDVPVLDIVAGLLGPAQRRVGELWVADEWSVAQEHAATAISEAALHTLAVERDADLRAGAGPDAPLVVVSCVEQEWHALPALIVAEHLRGAGFAVSYLGANASAQHLVRHVHELGPRAVLLSCSISSFLPLARRQVEAVRETGTPVMVGGTAFDPEGRRAAALGATAYAASAPDAVALVEGLPTAVTPAQQLGHEGADEAFLVFGERETLAEEVSRILHASLATQTPDPARDSWLQALDDLMPHLVGAVAGALVTGDPSVAGYALDWAETVLGHRGAPAEVGPALRRSLAIALHDSPAAARVLADLQGD